MRKFAALISARNKEFYRDKATLSWTFLFPFIVLVGFTYGYSGRQDPVIKVGTWGAAASNEAARALGETPGVALVAQDSLEASMRKVERQQLDLVIGVEPGLEPFYALNDENEKGRLAERLLKQTAVGAVLERRAASGKKLRYADWLLPGLIAMNIMFGSMFGVGYVIVRYRKNGVLKRLRATPLSAFHFLSAQIFSRMSLMVVTSLLVLAGAALAIGFRPVGSMIDFAVFLAVSSISMISLGLIVAARISSEEVADGVLNLMTWPMIFLSGVWFSLDGASGWVLGAAQAMPLTHVVNGLRAILNEGATLASVLPQIGILLGLSALFLGISSLIFRWR